MNIDTTTEPLSSTQPAQTPQPQTLVQTTDAPAASPDLERLLNGQPNLSLQPIAPAQPPTIVDAALPVAVPESKARRRGRIARLPKLQRDMVNHMLSNGIPYKNIVSALLEAGFEVNERNVSRWATGGGYLEWRLAQDLVTENRLAQDHLVDHLRREDASEISEVGLQAAATRLSQTLLQKAARAENIEGNLENFSRMVDILSRLNREISILQKQRDDSRRTLGPAHDAARIKNEELIAAQRIEILCSDPDDPHYGFDHKGEPILLPPIPTSRTLEIKDAYEKNRQEKERLEFMKSCLQSVKNKSTNGATPPEPGPRGETPARNGSPS